MQRILSRVFVYLSYLQHKREIIFFSLFCGLYFIIFPVQANEKVPIGQNVITKSTEAIQHQNDKGEHDKGEVLVENNHESEKEDNLFLSAKLSKDGIIIRNGMLWRIYGAAPDVRNRFPLLKHSSLAEPSFHLPPGTYFIYASFGRLSAQKRIIIKEDAPPLYEKFNFNAGGLKMSAQLAGGTIDLQKVRFSIYLDNSESEASLLLSNIKPQEIIRLRQGKYHIVSDYGSVNAIKRLDVNVQAGKVTEATLEHTAAKITLRLVRQKGGEALADTSWVITDSSGDSIYETAGAYAVLLLAEGDYTIIAKNKDSLYQKNIFVTSGQDQKIDISTQESANSFEDDAPMD